MNEVLQKRKKKSENRDGTVNCIRQRSKAGTKGI